MQGALEGCDTLHRVVERVRLVNEALEDVEATLPVICRLFVIVEIVAQVKGEVSRVNWLPKGELKLTLSETLSIQVKGDKIVGYGQGLGVALESEIGWIIEGNPENLDLEGLDLLLNYKLTFLLGNWL